MSEYYTPEVKDFYIGFKYEAYNSTYKEYQEEEWVELSFNGGETLSTLTQAVKDKTVRVKCLPVQEKKESYY